MKPAPMGLRSLDFPVRTSMAMLPAVKRTMLSTVIQNREPVRSCMKSMESPL